MPLLASSWLEKRYSRPLAWSRAMVIPALAAVDAQALRQRALDHRLLAAGALDHERGRRAHPAFRAFEAVVHHHQAALAAHAVGIGQHVLVHPASRGEEIVQQEILHPGEERPAVQQGEDLALVALDQVWVGLLVPQRVAEFHAVFFGETLHLAVTEHGQPGQGGHQHADAEILVALAELVHRGALVRVVHEVHVALEDFRVELQGVLDQRCGIWRFPRCAACS